jgi:F0F1-type ATP synthase membrane subunit b/b'
MAESTITRLHREIAEAEWQIKEAVKRGDKAAVQKCEAARDAARRELKYQPGVVSMYDDYD